MKISILNFYRRKDGFSQVFKTMQSRQNQRLQVLIVPQKLSVSIEKALFETLNCGASFFMDVTTFDRLADKYVVEKDIEFLSKSAGVMLIQKIVEDIKGELKILGSSCCYNGFCENVFNTIMLLKSSQVTPTQLLDAVDKLVDASKLKLLDIQKIYQIYEQTLKNRFIDSANKLDKLGQQIQFDEDVKNVDYYIYSPKLTRQVINVCDKLIKNSNSVTFLIDAYSEDSIVYDNNLDKIKQMLLNENNYDENIVQRFDSLSVQLKSVGSNKVYKNNHINFFSQKDVADELKNVCELIIKGKGRYKNNAVLVCDLQKYQSTIEKIFEDYNIPYFIDTQTSLLDLSPTKFLMQMINIVYDFKVDKVMSIIKSGYLNFDNEKIYDFELYLKRWGINERNFFVGNKPKDDLFNNFNEIYEFFVKIYKNFKQKLNKCKNYKEFISVIIEFLEKNDIENKISQQCDKLIKINELQKAVIYRQIYKKWMGLFEQLNNILGFNNVSIKNFYDVLQAGVSSILVKTPPLTIDSVYIGDLSNAMIYDYENLYVLGCVEGAFPSYHQDCGLILDNELNNMSSVAQINPTIRQINIENLCNIINNLACADNLFISYPISIFFVAQKPSTLVNNIKHSFVDEFGDELNFLNYEETTLLHSPKELSQSIRTKRRAEEFLREFNEQEYTNNKIIKYRINAIAKKLGIDIYYKEDLPKIKRILNKSSVSQLQTYFDCPYKNFVKYGLKLKENIDNTIKPIDVGNFMHKVAELFGKYLIDNNISFVLDESIFEEICRIALVELGYDAGSQKGKTFEVTQKTILHNLVNSARLMLRAINEQNKLSKFKIAFVEKNIEYALSNKDFQTIIYGKIDRVDKYDKYIRIIDYKTGSENFKVSDLLSGRRIQLFIYLGIIEKIEKLLPIGAYYFKIKDDFTSPYGDKDFLKSYCLNGVTIGEKEIILAQDTSLNEEHNDSDIIPVTCIFDDEFKVNNIRKGAYSKETLQSFINYAFDIFRQGVIEIASGNIAKSPYENACQYCEYYGVLCLGNKNSRKLKTKGIRNDK